MSVPIPASESLTDLQILAVLERITYCEAKVAHYIYFQDSLLMYHFTKAFANDACLDANACDLEAKTSMLHELRQQAIPAPHSLILAMEDKIARTIARGERIRERIKMAERKDLERYDILEDRVMVWAKRLMEARETEFEAKLKATGRVVTEKEAHCLVKGLAFIRNGLGCYR